MQKWKVFALIEILVIVALIGLFLYQKEQKSLVPEGLLSQSIYTETLAPENHLLFNFEPLKDALVQYLSKKEGVVGVYISNLRDGASIGINEEEEFEPASLNKIPMAILIMRQIEKGNLTLDTKIPITEQDADPSSGKLYQKVGTSVTVQELLHAMLAESDNTAFLVFSHVIDWNDWEKLSDYLNYYDVRIEKVNNKENNFYSVTPKSNAHLFTSLYLSTILEPEHSEYILKELTNTTFNIKKIAGLPENLTLSQKFGSYYGGEGEEYFHSCGIMYIGNGRFFYCVMTKGQSTEEAERTIGSIVKTLYDYVLEARKQIGNNLI